MYTTRTYANTKRNATLFFAAAASLHFIVFPMYTITRIIYIEIACGACEHCAFIASTRALQNYKVLINPDPPPSTLAERASAFILYVIDQLSRHPTPTFFFFQFPSYFYFLFVFTFILPAHSSFSLKTFAHIQNTQTLQEKNRMTFTKKIIYQN